MNFFDSVVDEVFELVKELPGKSYSFSDKKIWRDVGSNQVILQRDTAFELDGVGFNIPLSDIDGDGVIVIGDELADINKDRKFVRISLLKLQEKENEQDFYKLLKKADYVKYHCFPEGYMMRSVSRSHKESVRVAAFALKKGISFEKTGNLFISKYKENPDIKAAKIIFITDPEADFKAFEELAHKSSEITEALNHIMNNIKFDCDSCNLKPICDEIEGMKELHFKNSAMR